MEAHEKTLEHVEGDRRNNEEVHRGNRFPIIAEQGSQRLAGSGSRGARGTGDLACRNGPISTILFPINHEILYFTGFTVIEPLIVHAPARLSHQERKEHLMGALGRGVAEQCSIHGENVQTPIIIVIKQGHAGPQVSTKYFLDVCEAMF